MITRENYEEFFLLYIDNELPVAARFAVEKFVDENSDLREEWEGLLQCRMEPEQAPVFPHKNELLREEPLAHEPRLDSRDHPGYRSYESLLLSYVDGELDAKDKAAVEDFVSRHPPEAVTLQQLRMTVSQPDLSIVFPDKESLYRAEERRRLVPLYWLRAGVAAAVLVAGALLFLNRPHGKESLPVAVKEKKDPAPVTPPAATSLYPEKAQVKNNGIKEKAKPEETRRGIAPVPEKGSRQIPSQDLAVKTKPPTDRPVAPTVSTVDSGSTNDVAVDITTKPDKAEALQVVNTVAVNIPKDQSSFATQALLKESQENEAENIAADVSNGSAAPGKTKLRRIFRRVTRAFGKTADRDDEGQRQVLISAFQVALK